MMYAGKPTLRIKIYAFFDEHGTDNTLRELAERFSCCENSVQRYRREWRERGTGEGLARCIRCGFYEWEHNPVRNGLCLWCRADVAGVALEPLVRKWGWEAVIGTFRIQG
jgi:hypothetical protein